MSWARISLAPHFRVSPSSSSYLQIRSLQSTVHVLFPRIWQISLLWTGHVVHHQVQHHSGRWGSQKWQNSPLVFLSNPPGGWKCPRQDQMKDQMFSWVFHIRFITHCAALPLFNLASAEKYKVSRVRKQNDPAKTLSLWSTRWHVPGVGMTHLNLTWSRNKRA